jgi:endonuclease YncB( thermonuclease family)
MGQCLSATLKILIAANEASQQQEQTTTSQQQPEHDSVPHKDTTYKPTTATTDTTTISSSTISPSSSSKISPVYSSLPSGAESARVRNVYDGDTLTLTDERRVRFLGIDTPELKENQPFAKEARDYSTNHCEDKTIYLSFDGEKSDKYGRLLAHVYVKEGDGYLCVNEGIVAAGFASVYSPSQDQKTRNYDKLIQLQAQARVAKLGLHSDSGGATNSDQIVVKTKNGTAYHTRTCENLDPNWYLVELKISEAEDLGLHACRTCQS